MNINDSKIAVLGGSTPFTISFIDELLSQNIKPHHIALHGRNCRSLNLVYKYARKNMTEKGWSVSASTSLKEILSNATIVLHQIRYGGMSGRLDDEHFANRIGIPADETLGPAALRRILHTRLPLLETCKEITRLCPEAWILNLTNPLSVVTTLMKDCGIQRCIGLCELPVTTAEKVMAQLRLSSCDFKWSYVGLNHRGFIVYSSDVENEIPTILSNYSKQDMIAGFSTETISSLGAIPTKYFHLITESGAPAAGRAEYLRKLKIQLLDELDRNSLTTPPSLKKRDTSWYKKCVVPFLHSLTGSGDREHIINMTDDFGVTYEVHADVSENAITTKPRPQISAAVNQWLERYQAHESAMVNFIRDPDKKSLSVVLELDPIVKPKYIPIIENALVQEFGFT